MFLCLPGAHVTVEYERVYPPGGIVFLASLLSEAEGKLIFLTDLICFGQTDLFEQIIDFAPKCKFFVALTLSAKTFP